MNIFPGISEEFDEIISAAILTASAILGIILLDRCADKVEQTSKDPVELASFPLQGIMLGAEARKLQVSNLEKAIRSIINSFALAVGLSWEKAFHAALETVIKSNPIMDKHYVISQVLLAFGNCVLIMPVWLSFIVPMAKKTWQDHQKLMDLSN